MAFLAPIATAAVGAVSSAPLLAASTALSAVGTLQQGRAESQALRYNSLVARNNAAVAEKNAADAWQQSSLDMQSQDLAAGQEIGQIIAEAMGSGLTGGSINMREASARRLAARDRVALRSQGANQQREWLQRAQDLRTDAAMGRASARNARTATMLNFGTSLISGASAINRNKILSLQAEM